jgi:hypothetical protein
MNSQMMRRADFLLGGDFEGWASVDPSEDPLFGRPVPTTSLRALHAERFGKHGWLAFKQRTIKRWIRFIKTSPISDSDKLYLSWSLRESLGENP